MPTSSSSSLPPRPSRSDRRPSTIGQHGSVRQPSRENPARIPPASDYSISDASRKRDSITGGSSHNRSLLSRVSGIFREKGDKDKPATGLARAGSISQGSFMSRHSDRSDVVEPAAPSPRVALVRAPQHLALAHLAPSPAQRTPAAQQARRSSVSVIPGGILPRQIPVAAVGTKSPASSLSSGRSRQRRRERETQQSMGLNKKSSSAGIVAATYGATYRLSEFQTTYSPSGLAGLQSNNTVAPTSTSRAIFAPEDFSSGRRSRRQGQQESPSPVQLSIPRRPSTANVRRSISPGKRHVSAPAPTAIVQPHPPAAVPESEVTSQLEAPAPIKQAKSPSRPPITLKTDHSIVQNARLDPGGQLDSPLSSQPHTKESAIRRAAVTSQRGEAPSSTVQSSSPKPPARQAAPIAQMKIDETVPPAKQLAALPPLATLADFCLKAGLAGSPFASQRHSAPRSPNRRSIASPHLWSLGDSPESTAADSLEPISSGAVASAFAKAPGGLVNVLVKDEQARIYLHAFNACASIGPTAHAASLLRSLLDAGAKGAAAILLIEGEVVLLERVWDGAEPDNLSEKMLEILQATEDRDDDVKVYLTSSSNVTIRPPELHVLDACPVTSATGHCIGAMTVFGSSATPGGSGAAWTTLSASLLECVAQDISLFLESVRRDVLSQRLDTLDGSLSEWTSQVAQTEAVTSPATSNVLGLQPISRRPTTATGRSTQSERYLQLALRSISETLGASLAYIAYVCEEPLACCVVQTLSAPGALAPTYLLPDPEMHHSALSATRKGYGIERDIDRTHALLGLGDLTTSEDALHSALVVPCITPQTKRAPTPENRSTHSEAAQGWTLGVAFSSSMDSMNDDPTTAPSPLTPEAIIYLLRFASLLAPLLESSTAELGFTEVLADADLTVGDTLGLSPPVIAGLMLGDTMSGPSSGVSHGDSSGRDTSTLGQHGVLPRELPGGSSSSTEHSSSNNSGGFLGFRGSSLARPSYVTSSTTSNVSPPSLERARDIAKAKRSRQRSAQSPTAHNRRASILSSNSSESMSPGRPSFSSAFEILDADDRSSTAHDRERTMSVSSIGSDMRVQGSIPSPTMAGAAAFASPFFKAPPMPGSFDEMTELDPVLAKLAEEARLHIPGSDYARRHSKSKRFSNRSRSSSVSSSVLLPPRPGPPPSSDLPLTPAPE